MAAQAQTTEAVAQVAEQAPDQAPDRTPGESNRDRVRRVLIRPLAEAGMRFPHRTDADSAQRKLDRICDEMAHVSDQTLGLLREWAKANGQGSARCFWPGLVSFIGLAQTIEPRPMEELPVLARWFGSRAGPAARAEGRLVAEFVWIEKHRCPPQNAHQRNMVAETADRWRRRVELATDRLARGVDPGPGERTFLDWYRSIEARAEALIAEGEAKRGEVRDAG